jgi:pyruvate dehydrogenase E2 component (dihydrolipoamide acetyltransferase)
MAIEIRVPRLGWSMEEGTFVGWLKRDGEPVEVGQPLYELEGEKATQEIESLDAGILHIPENSPKPGTLIPVGELLGYVLAPGESPPTAGKTENPPASSQSQQASGGQVAQEMHSTKLVQSSMPSSDKRATPRAKKLASQLGIEWSSVPGTGRGGRIREADIRTASTDTSHARASLSAAELDTSTHRVVLRGRRLAIANRMLLSRQKTVPVTLTTQADVSGLVTKRNQWKASLGGAAAPSYSDCFAYLAARLLVRHPNMAAVWENDEVIRVPATDSISVGIAVDTPDGLLVPVIRDASRLSFADFVSKSKRAIAKCRHENPTTEDLTGGCFSVSSLGHYGIDAFTPIINYPEVAILGLGAIRPQADRADLSDQHGRQMMTLSLTFDHRANDGAPAAAFLQSLVQAVLENDLELDIANA